MLDPDSVTLATKLGDVLVPALPYLLKSGEKAAEEAGKQIGVDAWQQVKALWERLRPRLEERPAAQAAAEEVAIAPHDEDAVAALRLQLRNLFAEDAALAAEIAPLTEQARAQISVHVSGTRAVGFAGNMSGGSINTGDQSPPRHP